MTKSKAYTLLAFDPGERTGYCLARVNHDAAKDRPDFDIIEQGVLTVREIGHDLADLVSRADLVAYETWRLYADYATKMVGNDMQPSQVVGMIRYECWQQNVKIVSNGASIKKVSLGTMPDELKEHMAKSSEQHDQDAIMHAWYVAFRAHYKGSNK